ncbi:MAG: carboxy-S-adenosyl-L-methionine synthase CmoA [Porticoccaceae bacterium]|jgi:tRNA (cmo5U34)-methyltransferase|nr:carboxy-S-adenosyl-L-methionine synthase CmoA [Porticoccaceae bacterium]
MSDTPKQDNLFASPLGNVPRFAFDEAVVDVFPDMIQRSVPGYQTIINLCGELAARYVQPNSNCYDLGCSLGASSLAIAQQVNQPGVSIVAVDNSAAMLSRCASVLEQGQTTAKIELVEADICDIEISNASLVVMNFTLQFIAIDKRQALVEKIYAGLNPGGCLVISEKLLFEPESLNQLLSELHHQFKSAQGYSDLEISQKRDSLENFLLPETLETHINRIKACGFNSASPWFQCFNFASLVAIK